MSATWSGEAQVAEVIGHELRNPLASAVANLSVAGEMTDAGDPRSTFLQRALSELDRVSTLLSSYLERDGSPRAAIGIDLIECLRKVTSRAAEQAQRRGQRCRPRLLIESEGQIPRLQGDPVLVERMFENLLENAISVGARTVLVRVRKHGENCVFFVEDDGPGVPEELGVTIFEAGVSGRGSSGLGLALCRDAAMHHGGAIRLRRSGPGACFEVTLPVSWH